MDGAWRVRCAGPQTASAAAGGQIEEQLDHVLDASFICSRTAGGRCASSPITAGCSRRAVLPSLPLKKYLAECRWSRCAVIKEGAQADVPAAGWFWDTRQPVGLRARGVLLFSGTEYAQRRIESARVRDARPDIPQRHRRQAVVVKIRACNGWGNAGRVVIEPAVEGLFADLRSKPNDRRQASRRRNLSTRGQGRAAGGRWRTSREPATSIVVFDATAGF